MGYAEQRVPEFSTALSTSVDKKRGSCTEQTSNKQVMAEEASQEAFSSRTARKTQGPACGNVSKTGERKGTLGAMSVDKSTDPPFVHHVSA